MIRNCRYIFTAMVLSACGQSTSRDGDASTLASTSSGTLVKHVSYTEDRADFASLMQSKSAGDSSWLETAVTGAYPSWFVSHQSVSIFALKPDVKGGALKGPVFSTKTPSDPNVSYEFNYIVLDAFDISLLEPGNYELRLSATGNVFGIPGNPAANYPASIGVRPNTFNDAIFQAGPIMGNPSLAPLDQLATGWVQLTSSVNLQFSQNDLLNLRGPLNVVVNSNAGKFVQFLNLSVDIVKL